MAGLLDDMLTRAVVHDGAIGFALAMVLLLSVSLMLTGVQLADRMFCAWNLAWKVLA